MDIIYFLFDLLGRLLGWLAEQLMLLFSSYPLVMILLTLVTSAALYFGERAARIGAKKNVLALDPNIPKELLFGKLVSSEKHIACRSPRPMHGTPDRVYKNGHGRFIPIDIKTRGSQQVHQTDVVQLSVYRQILKRKGAVEDYGYIRFDSYGPPTYKKVTLLDEKSLIRHYDRQKAVMAGQVRPKGARHKGMCTGCGHKAECDLKPN